MGEAAPRHPPLVQLLTKQSAIVSGYFFVQLLLELGAAYGCFVAGDFFGIATKDYGYWALAGQAGAYLLCGYYAAGVFFDLFKLGRCRVFKLLDLPINLTVLPQLPPLMLRRCPLRGSLPVQRGLGCASSCLQRPGPGPGPVSTGGLAAAECAVPSGAGCKCQLRAPQPSGHTRSPLSPRLVDSSCMQTRARPPDPQPRTYKLCGASPAPAAWPQLTRPARRSTRSRSSTASTRWPTCCGCESQSAQPPVACLRLAAALPEAPSAALGPGADLAAASCN